jgi:hypothetical protein
MFKSGDRAITVGTRFIPPGEVVEIVGGPTPGSDPPLWHVRYNGLGWYVRQNCLRKS